MSGYGYVCGGQFIGDVPKEYKQKYAEAQKDCFSVIEYLMSKSDYHKHVMQDMLDMKWQGVIAYNIEMNKKEMKECK